MPKVSDEGQINLQLPESSEGPTTSVQEVGEALTSPPPTTVNNPP